MFGAWLCPLHGTVADMIKRMHCGILFYMKAGPGRPVPHACDSTSIAAGTLATCHSVCHASHAAASPACEKAWGWDGCLWAGWGWWGHHHRTLARALARPTTVDSAHRLVVRPWSRVPCTIAPAHPQPSTRHALGEAAVVAPPKPVRPAVARFAEAASGCRGTRAASGSLRCRSRRAYQCRGRSRGSRSSHSQR